MGGQVTGGFAAGQGNEWTGRKLSNSLGQGLAVRVSAPLHDHC